MTAACRTGPPDTADWRDRAACARHPKPDIFFPTGRGTEEVQAKNICGRCPVAEQCVREAVRTGSMGIWASTSTRQRQRRHRAAPTTRR